MVYFRIMPGSMRAHPSHKSLWGSLSICYDVTFSGLNIAVIYAYLFVDLVGFLVYSITLSEFGNLLIY